MWGFNKAIGDTHGGLVRRRVFSSMEAAALDALSGWPSLRTVLAVASIRSVKSAPTKLESEICYLLMSGPDNPAILGKAIRSHWAVESTAQPAGLAQDRAQRRRSQPDNQGQLERPTEKTTWNDAYVLKILLE